MRKTFAVQLIIACLFLLTCMATHCMRTKADTVRPEVANDAKIIKTIPMNRFFFDNYSMRMTDEYILKYTRKAHRIGFDGPTPTSNTHTKEERSTDPKTGQPLTEEEMMAAFCWRCWCNNATHWFICNGSDFGACQLHEGFYCMFWAGAERQERTDINAE